MQGGGPVRANIRSQLQNGVERTNQIHLCRHLQKVHSACVAPCADVCTELFHEALAVLRIGG
jgi:hypothetical protein